MEDIRPYRNEENDRFNDDTDRRYEFELSRVESDDELPFDIPRD